MSELKENPLVTVLIASYNSSDYISETIDSVLNQTYKNFELIVVDDGSTDNTIDILESFSKKDQRVKFYEISHSGRPAIPFNYGLRIAKGKYAAFLGSDDIWKKEKLNEQIKYLEKHLEDVLVYSMSVTFGDVNIFSPLYEVLPLPFRAAKNKQDLINIGNTLPASSVLARLDIIKKVNYHDEDPELKLEDYHLWLKMTDCGTMGFIPKILVYYRIHKNQFSGNWDERRNRIKYLAKKTGLPIPEYKEIRNRGLILRIVRNLVHYSIYALTELLSLFGKLFKK